jgi:hypothetical protein
MWERLCAAVAESASEKVIELKGQSLCLNLLFSRPTSFSHLNDASSSYPYFDLSDCRYPGHGVGRCGLGVEDSFAGDGKDRFGKARSAD